MTGGELEATGAGIDGLVPFRVPMRLRFRRTDVGSASCCTGRPGGASSRRSPSTGPSTRHAGSPPRARPPSTGFPAPVRDRVPVNTTVPAVDAAPAAALVRDSGCTTAKVKVAEPGQTLADDVERVAAVRDALGPAGRVRIDANGAWDVETALVSLARLERHDLEYVEQPCATLDELAEVRRRGRVPVAADESIRTAEDPIRAAQAGAVDVVVLKVQPLGGVRRALEVADAAGVPAVVSSALETSIGLAAGVAFAAALPELPYACGLGTATLLAGDVVADPLVPRDGHLAVRRPAPDPALLDQHAPDPDTATALLDRLAAADAAGRRRRGPT